MRSREKLAFFAVREKLHWLKMPMGALKAGPLFAAMMGILQAMWQVEADIRKINAGSEVIIGDIMLFAKTLTACMEYFEIVLQVMKHHCCTLK